LLSTLSLDHRDRPVGASARDVALVRDADAGRGRPPPEVMTGPMSVVRNLTPLWHGVRVMQDAWLGLNPGVSWFVVIGILATCGLVGVRYFRWE
jgi:hypothetical protein